MKRRILSSLMALVLVFGLLPATAFAEETPGTEPEVTAVEAPSAEEGKTQLAAPKVKIGDKEYDTLEAAVTEAVSGATIQLGEGNYTLYGVSSEGHTKGKDLTFVGRGADKTGWNIGAEVPDPANFGTEYNGDYSFDGAGTVTFQNMTLRSGTANYLGFIRANNTVVENCTINGKTFYWGYKSATFTNTTFNCPSLDYAIWTYSSPVMTFDNCTFNSHGKVINVYTDFGAGKNDIIVNFKGCTVTGSSVKQVLNVNDSNMGDFKYVLNISGNNTVSGVPCDKTTCSRLYGFGGKAGNNTGRLDVTIEDTLVWSNGKMLTHKYSAGEQDNAFKYSYGEWTNNGDGTQSRKVTKTCKYCGYETKDKETQNIAPIDWDVSKSKTATKLDKKTWTSDVTLSLPSAEEKLASDVVFVLDKSSCKKETAASAAQMLTALQSQVQSNGSKIQVGVVVFGGDARVSYPLEAFPATEAALKELSTALSTRPDGLMGGSNMHAGLLAAQEMLRCSTTDANRKYVILVSDGLTRLFTGSDGKTKDIYYQYTYQDMTGDKQVGTEEGQISPKDCVYFGMIDEWTSVRTKETNTALRPIPYGSWDTYFSKVKDWVRTDGDAYALNYETYGNDPTEKVKNKVTGEITDTDFKYIGHNDYENHAMSVDRAVYEAYDSFTGMVDSGYRCYAVLPDSGTPFGTAFMDALNEYAHNSVIDFAGIGADILYTVSAGSTVEDKMGDAFDFVPGSLKLTVGGTELQSKADDNVTYFSDNAEELNETDCRFMVLYDPTADAFVWTINENVSNFAPVQLTYTVKLTKPETDPGTYGVEDLKGEKTLSDEEAEKALFTNERAVLNAKNSAGAPVKEQVFPKPSVSYTVKSSGGGGGGSSTTYYYFAIEKVDAQDGHALNGAKFGLYLDGKQVATATSNRSGIALFRVSAGDYRKINAKSELYYQELTAPEGYVVSGGKIDMEKDDLTTNQAAAEKKAETVRNYRGVTPDLLNDSDHFAYVIGYKDGNVRLYGLISRAETTTIFFRLLKDSVRDSNLLTSNTYTDVADDYWANTAISTMTGLGIVQGRSATTFDPKAPITRAQFAAICARFDTGKSSGTQTFTDIKGHWAEKYIQRAAELGWIKGFEDGSFRPDTYITRAQAMTMINRVLNRIPEENSDLLAGMNTWPDCNPGDWFYLAVQEATNSHDFKHKAGNYETWTGMNKNPDWTRYEH